LAATKWSEDIGIEIKVKSASIPDKETFFNTNLQQKLLPCFEPSLGFKAFHSVQATIDGIETAHMIKKGQLSKENIPA
jgi:hypothetical protein